MSLLQLYAISQDPLHDKAIPVSAHAYQREEDLVTCTRTNHAAGAIIKPTPAGAKAAWLTPCGLVA